MKKKILFVIPTLGGGGAEKVLVNLVNNLNKEKFDITVQTLFDEGINKKYLKPYIHYKSVFKKVFYGNIHFLKIFSKEFLYRKIIKDEYDIVISYLEGPTTRIVAGCNNHKTKLINWVHTEMKSVREFKSSYRSMKEMQEAYEKYNLTVFVAKTTQNNFNQHTNIKLKKEVVIRNIVEVDEIKAKAKEKIVKNDEVTLVTLARLVKCKGYDRLLRIHKRLLDEGVKHKIWILGEGPERKKIENYIKNNKLQETVKLMGYQENPYKYIDKSDIYVCASYVEGYSTAITEAVIIGKPIITTLCSGMNEILDNGEYGMIVENDEDSLYQGVKKMILNKKLREQYQEKAQKRSEFFEVKKQIEQIEKILNT